MKPWNGAELREHRGRYHKQLELCVSRRRLDVTCVYQQGAGSSRHSRSASPDGPSHGRVVECKLKNDVFGMSVHSMRLHMLPYTRTPIVANKYVNIYIRSAWRPQGSRDQIRLFRPEGWELKCGLLRQKWS